jgi:hypothetical protein
MTGTVTFPGIEARPSKARRESARTAFPPRPPTEDWPATRQERGEAFERLTSGIFVLDNEACQERRRRAVKWFLDWLSDQPGETWQQRWMASGADEAGGRELEAGADRLAARARPGIAVAASRAVRSPGRVGLR